MSGAFDFSIIQAITLVVAVLGAVLGVINTWHGLDKSRVKLVVRPKHAIAYGGLDERIEFCIQVTNLSAFPVTITEVGVLYKGNKLRGVIRPILIDGGKWPRRLDPRSSVTAYAYKPTPTDGNVIACAFAATECGFMKKGSSPALKQIAAGIH